MSTFAATVCQGGKPMIFYEVVYRSPTALAAEKKHPLVLDIESSKALI